MLSTCGAELSRHGQHLRSVWRQTALSSTSRISDGPPCAQAVGAAGGVWALAALSDGDVLAAADAGGLLLFSRAPSRAAPKSLQASQQVSSSTRTTVYYYYHALLHGTVRPPPPCPDTPSPSWTQAAAEAYALANEPAGAAQPVVPGGGGGGGGGANAGGGTVDGVRFDFLFAVEMGSGASRI